ncbi:MAG: metallophosphoesterase [Candidatus Latescibacteria bacterium]|jgi:DNA repair exonuclease SbcCD nuclease subunit|nr:metallophosphoesterase [Candidatus Latescibacterota bacterium]
MSWTFAHISDIHVGTPRSYRFQPAWAKNWQTARKQIVELSPDFLLIGGDLTRDGATHRFELDQIKADLDNLPFPCYAIPGNHDVGNKYLEGQPHLICARAVDRFSEVFGSTEWSFEHKGVRFGGFNALLAGSGLPEEERMWSWLEDQARNQPQGDSVWLLHPTLFMEDPDEPSWDPEADRLEWIYTVDQPHRGRILDALAAAGATLAITSHVHCRHTLSARGIRIQASPSTAFSQACSRWIGGDPALGFLHCRVDGSGISPEFIPLEQESDAPGYGPGGSPAMADRDYSIAREKPSLLDLGLDAPM